MIFGPRLEPDHHFNEYLNFSGDDDDFIRTCFKYGEPLACQHCGECCTNDCGQCEGDDV